MKQILFLILAIFLTSCVSSTSTGPLFIMHAEPGDELSLVYFYNTETGSSGNVCLKVTVDGDEMGCMGSPGYVITRLSPGEHSFSFRPDSIIDLGIEMRQFDLVTEGGSTTYIRSKVITSEDNPETILQSNYVSAYNGFTVGWVVVPEDEALKQLQVLRQWK